MTHAPIEHYRDGGEAALAELLAAAREARS